MIIDCVYITTVIENFNGNNETVWTPNINPSNTFEERYSRWKRLLDVIFKNNQSGVFVNSQILLHRDKEIDNFMKNYRESKKFANNKV